METFVGLDVSLGETSVAKPHNGADITSLNTMSRAVSCESAPFMRTVFPSTPADEAAGTDVRRAVFAFSTTTAA
jgi:hypothetical protein